VKPVYKSDLGELFQADCLDLMPTIRRNSVDLIFADPPFNLKKEYDSPNSDDLSESEYLAWSREWLSACVPLLKEGGAMFVYNIPRWNIPIGAYLMELGLNFRHAIAVEQKNSLPIQKKLYPAHYSLLYFTKGKPKRFQRVRTPIEECRHCGGEIRDYGGHRSAMNPNGVNLKDIWTDIPPVRHRKYKSELRKANALSTKLIERVLEIASFPGDLIFDPFGGSGTTYAVCEQRKRRWIGCEIGDSRAIVARLQNGEVANHRNTDFVELHPDNPDFETLAAAE
jgi:site-specific DNA-methyltransferase (adenine-specific)